MSQNFPHRAAGSIDLSMPIGPHWRFAPEISYTNKEVGGCAFHSTGLRMGAHGFTHVDAPLHVDPDGAALHPGDLDALWGRAVVLDVSSVGPDAEITPEALAASKAEIGAGDILLVRSRHEERHPTTTPEYWTRAPWMGRAAAEWCAATGAGAVGFDFPQDRGIRSEYVDGWEQRDLLDDWPCHQILLRRGIFQIEYLRNLGALEEEATLFFAVPLNLERADGSPVRAFALPHAL